MKTRMSLKTFITKLRRLRGQFEVTREGGFIRTRATFEVEGGRKCLCPIEAVSLLVFKGQPDDMALGLFRTTRRFIMDGADDNAAVGRAGTVRRQMLNALKLQEI